MKRNNTAVLCKNLRLKAVGHAGQSHWYCTLSDLKDTSLGAHTAMSLQDELAPIPKDWASHTVSTLLKLMEL